MNKTNKSFQFDSKRIHLTRSSFSCLANNNKPTCLLYGLLFHVQIPPRPLGIMPVCISRKMIMSAYFCFQLRKPYKCECFLFQNISVTLALSIPMPFQFEELYSVSSHQKHIECFARFRSYQRSRRSHLSHTGPLNTLAVFTRNCEWLRVSNFRTAVKMSQNKCVRDIFYFHDSSSHNLLNLGELFQC